MNMNMNMNLNLNLNLVKIRDPLCTYRVVTFICKLIIIIDIIINGFCEYIEYLLIKIFFKG